MNLVDSHAHLDLLEDLEGALERAKTAGVSKIISVGTTLEESKMIIKIADKKSADKLKIYTTAGIHPKDGKEEVEKLGLVRCFKTLKQIAMSSQNIVAIGECGLDYYTDSDKQKATSDKEKEFQRELFEAQIELAAELDLPIVIHCRNGWDEVFEILSSYNNYSSSGAQRSREVLIEKTSLNGKFSINSNNKIRGVFHSWTGTWTDAQKALDLGFYISFSGIVTFKNAKDIQEVAKKAPLNRILVETDSPFLTPEPLRSTPFEKSQDRQGKLGRGKTNEPKNVRITAQFIAQLRNQPFDKIAGATTRNAESIFRIKSI